ncbi:glycoside hydrolase family 36 protein [Agromyces laixinhei]|uniref:glycoside hydrolase family 36 protein n=1 Tax=Agromyces laixinhei TaxID=2585717 RepID=UPI001E36CF83|nr:glycoside hydrolase family 36 protein [Agromyces laixinhei]
MTDALQRLQTLPNTELRPEAPTTGVPERVRVAEATFDVQWSADQPAALVVRDSPFGGRASVPLVEIFTAEEQRARTSQAYFRSAVGARMRVIAVSHEEDAAARRTLVSQRDATTGLEADTVISQPWGVSTVRAQTRLRNAGTRPVVITAVTSLSFGFGLSESDLDDVRLAVADSEWLAEDRWSEIPLRAVLPGVSLGFHEQDGRGHYGLSSHGAWSSGEHVPCGILTSGDGSALAWQIETSAGWHVDISQARDGGVLSLLGPTDLENHFAHRIAPGDTFDAVPVSIASSHDGRDGVVAALTAYRRWLRRGQDTSSLPVVYNDFMNTLMGQPTTEQLLPLVAAAADAGAEVFCIDAGWFAEPEIGDWWATVGEWQEANTRFTAGLKQITDEILSRGMRVGLWLEPEVVGADSPVADVLPDDAFFWRHGQRVMEHRRYHLDFRHPAARAHMDEVVDRIVAEYGVSYIKLDYNINPGAGTERDATAAGDGLLGHTRAFREWLIDVQQRHPGLQLENCSSGAMRADYSLLEVTHQQSTSDQQDFRLYPPIAASAPMSILPEQCANWAYPAAGMTDEETAFTLVTGLSGRLYLSGFLHELTNEQRALVADAAQLHKRVRRGLSAAVPFWPLGLPDWDADTIVLGLHTDDGDLLFVWDRHSDARTLTIPGITGTAAQLFPALTGAAPRVTLAGLQLQTPAGAAARMLHIVRS